MTLVPDSDSSRIPSVGGSPWYPPERSWISATGDPARAVGGLCRSLAMAVAMSETSSRRKLSGAVAKKPSRLRIRSSSASMLDPSALSLEARRSEEHTSELQSRGHLVCRLLLEKKKHDLEAHTSLG